MQSTSNSSTCVDVACYRHSSMICLSLSLSGTIVSHAKMVEPIEVPFRFWTLVGPRSHVLDGVQICYVQWQFSEEKDGQL